MLSNFRDAKSALPSSFNAREFILATCSGILLFSSVLPGLAQDGQKQQNTNGRRIAMVLPKAQASLKVVVAEPKPVKAAHLLQSSQADPQVEFASRPQISEGPKQKALPNNFRELIIDGAEKAEQMSRSYNRRVADLIVYIANSMMSTKSTTFTPAIAPHLRPQRPIEPKPLIKNGDREPMIFQID